MVDTVRPPSSKSNPLLSTAEQTLYMSKVGSCLWLVNSTRPESLYALNMLSRHTHAPTVHDMK